MADSASSSAASAIQFGDNNSDGSGGLNPIVLGAVILGGLAFLGFLIYAAMHRKS
jgi:hypothetical protein